MKEKITDNLLSVIIFPAIVGITAYLWRTFRRGKIAKRKFMKSYYDLLCDADNLIRNLTVVNRCPSGEELKKIIGSIGKIYNHFLNRKYVISGLDDDIGHKCDILNRKMIELSQKYHYESEHNYTTYELDVVRLLKEISSILESEKSKWGKELKSSLLE